jgi:hypothetical protein
MQAQRKIDAVANELMNQGRDQPVDKLGTLGDEPLAQEAVYGPAHTGGKAEYELRRQYAQDALKDQINRAKLETATLRQQAATRGGGGGRSPWRGGGGGGSASRAITRATTGGGKPGKPAAYVYSPDNPQGDSFKSIQNDAKTMYGKNGYDKLQQASGLVHLDDKTGKYVSDNPDLIKVNPDTGDMTFVKDGTQISGADAGTFIRRSNAVRVENGMEPQHLNTYASQYPESGAKAGSQENPYAPKTAGEVAGLPAGSWVVNPADGKAYQKAPPAKRGQAAAPPPAETATTADTGTDVDSDQAALDEAAQIPPPEETDQEPDTGATTQAAPPNQGPPIAQGAPPPQLAAADSSSYLPTQSADVNPTPFVARDSQPSTIAAVQPPTLPDQEQAPTAPDPQVADAIARSQAADELSGGDQTDALERAIAQMRQNQGVLA